MNKSHAAVAIGVLASALACAALADTTPEISVQASRVVKKDAGTTYNGIPLKSISLSYEVSYTGLDLSSVAGAAELERRVNNAADAVCKEVGRQYPDSTPSNEDCAKQSANRAMVKVHQLVSAAAKK